MNHIKKADIGIIGAMQIEVEALCASMTETQTETVGNMEFVYGDLWASVWSAPSAASARSSPPCAPKP